MSDLETLEEEARLVRSRHASFRNHVKALREKAAKAAQQAIEIEAKADKEEIYLQFLETQIASARSIASPEILKAAKPRCEPPCGKRRYKSEKAAKQDNKTNNLRVRIYWSEACCCFHATKQVRP